MRVRLVPVGIVLVSLTAIGTLAWADLRPPSVVGVAQSGAPSITNEMFARLRDGMRPAGCGRGSRATRQEDRELGRGLRMARAQRHVLVLPVHRPSARVPGVLHRVEVGDPRVVSGDGRRTRMNGRHVPLRIAAAVALAGVLVISPQTHLPTASALTVFSDTFASASFAAWTGTTNMTIDPGTGRAAPPERESPSGLEPGLRLRAASDDARHGVHERERERHLTGHRPARSCSGCGRPRTARSPGSTCRPRGSCRSDPTSPAPRRARVSRWGPGGTASSCAARSERPGRGTSTATGSRS